MGLFNKKQVKPMGSSPSLPSLPELPKRPDFPSRDEDKQIHKLPSFPSSSLGTKFSQDTIKGAVTGEEGDGNGHADEPEYDDEDEEQMMPEPLKKPMTREIGSGSGRIPGPTTQNTGPVFIRVDKFEDAMDVFNTMRKKITEIEKILSDLKAVKDKEDKELTGWQGEIESLKNQIEKVNVDIFSRV